MPKPSRRINVKNHVNPPAEFIAPPSFRALKARNGDVQNFHYTPYLPIKDVYIFLITICGQKGYGNLNEQCQMF